MASKYRAVILVPQEVELSYANNLKAAIAATMAHLKEVKPVGKHAPKLLEIIGPDSEIEPWAKQARDLRDARLAPKHPPLGDDDDPPPLTA